MKRWKVFCNDDLSLKKDALAELQKIAEVEYFLPNQNLLLKNIKHFDAYYASAHVQMNRAVLDGMLGFTGGVMVAASFWS